MNEKLTIDFYHHIIDVNNYHHIIDATNNKQKQNISSNQTKEDDFKRFHGFLRQDGLACHH